jgi:hypothetical protein
MQIIPATLFGALSAIGLFIALVMVSIGLFKLVDKLFLSKSNLKKLPMFLHKELKFKFMSKYKDGKNQK